MNGVPKLGFDERQGRVKEEQPVNGWLVSAPTSATGVPITRCAPLRRGLDWTDLPADAVYPLSQKDANGNDYNGVTNTLR